MTTALPSPKQLHVGCKVNVYLEIHGKRDDGYHNLSTLFLPLPTPCDILSITPGPLHSGLVMTCSDTSIPQEQNLISRCYALFNAATGRAPDLNVHLQKGIPVGAGLGGGSSDAATFLKFLNESSGVPQMDTADLHALGGQLGADVPFFLFNQPAWATGRGDQLTPIHIPLDGMTMVLACPAIHVSTAWAYKAWDQMASASPPNTLTPQTVPDIITSLSNFPFHNSFEIPVFTRYPELRLVKELLLASGANGVVMSGSGASLFSLFRDDAHARQAAAHLRNQGIPAFLTTLGQ